MSLQGFKRKTHNIEAKKNRALYWALHFYSPQTCVVTSTGLHTENQGWMADTRPATEAQRVPSLPDTQKLGKASRGLDGTISPDKGCSEKDFGRISSCLMGEEILLNTWCSFHAETAGYREETAGRPPESCSEDFCLDFLW